MDIVSRIEELSFFLRRFAPRIVLRVGPDFVEASSREGRVQATPFLIVIRQGNRPIVAGIGDDPVTSSDAVRVPVFSGVPAGGSAEHDDLVESFITTILARLPKSGGVIRPVVVVDNLSSLEAPLLGRQRELIARALTRWGAAAVVIG